MFVDHLRADRVGVRCYKKGRKYIIDPEKGELLVFVKAGCPIVLLKDTDMVVGPNGEQAKPTGRFYRSAETIDPYHIIFDVF